MPSHRHAWRSTQRLMLTLPDVSGRYDLLSVFVCECGAQHHCTSSSLHAGRHLTYAEFREVQRQESLYGAGHAKRERASTAIRQN